MNKISFDEFYEKYGVKRNPIHSISNYQNTMLDFDDEEVDYIEENNPNNIWTLTEDKSGLTLNPGILYVNNVMGFFICKEKWNKNEEGYILQ